MIEPTEIEQQQETPAERELAIGPLLPRWFKVVFYATVGPLSLFALIYIGRSLYIQRMLTSSVVLLKGGLEGQLSDLSVPEAQAALEVLRRRPVDAFLYCNQELLQDEERDPRMARALALRKAIDWGTISTRRNVIRKIIANMAEGGFLEADVLDSEDEAVLKELIEERRADPETTYVEQRVTDVLVWLAQGAKTRPKGFEKKRLASLLAEYEKKRFVGKEADALEALMAKWSASTDPVGRQAAEHFSKMLEGTRTDLPPEAVELCAERADRWEGLYRQGMVFLAEAGMAALEEVLDGGRWLDHPHIYQYISLLGNRFDEVHKMVAEGVWLLRHKYYAIRFLSVFASRTSINPVMAVETVRLTREEHERQMRRVNERRMRGMRARLLGRLGVDYIRNRADYPLPRAEDADDYVRKYVLHVLEVLGDDERVGDLAKQAVADMREADTNQPGGPVLFTGEG